MKKLNNCQVTNCIPQPSGCVEWDGGDIAYLGICNGDPLNNIIWEIVAKLEDIAGEDLSSFDLDSLIDLCSTKAPSEVTILNILNVVKANQICFKDYLTKLSDQIAELGNESKININLKCYQEFDNNNNALSITRDALDQLVINELCGHEQAIEQLQGKLTTMQEAIDDLVKTQSTGESSVSTCIDSENKPVSTQLVKVAKAHCELEAATGDASDIAKLMAMTPASWDKFKTQPGWIASPSNQAEWLNNVAIVLINNEGRTTFMEENCCAVTCDDILLDFSAAINEDGTSIVITFNNATGTKIPSGFIDKGSKGTITDKNGLKQNFTLAITNNYQIEVPITGLDKTELKVNINAQIGNATLICSKCLNKIVTASGCAICEITATGDSGAVAVIVYEDNI